MRYISFARHIMPTMVLILTVTTARAESVPTVDFTTTEIWTLGPQDLAVASLEFVVPGRGDTLHILPSDARVVDWASASCQLHRTSREPFELSWQDEDPGQSCAFLSGVHADSEFLVRLAGQDDVYRLLFELPAIHGAEVELLRTASTSVEHGRYTTNVRVVPDQDLRIGPDSPTYLFDGRWKPICLDGPAVEGSQILCGDASEWGRPSGQLGALDMKSAPGLEDGAAVRVDVLTGRLTGAEPKPVLLVAEPIDGERILRTFVLVTQAEPLVEVEHDVEREGLEAWCRREVAEFSGAQLLEAGFEDTNGRRARRWAKRHWSYAACADFIGSRPEGVLTLATADGMDPVSEHSQAHLYSERDIVVFVRHTQGTRPEVEFSSPTSGLVRDGVADDGDPTGPAEAESDERVSRFGFAPLLGEDVASVSVRVESVSGQVTSLRHGYRVERRTIGAVRLGCAVAYAPAARTHALVGVMDGSGDQVIDVAGGEGSPPGLFDLELVAGYSWFFRPMAALGTWHRGRPSPRIGAGWYAGLGLVSGGGSGFELLKSVHTGPELLLGQQLAIGLVASCRRVWSLADDYAELQVVPAGFEIRQAQRFGVTFGVGVVVNFSPAGFGSPARPAVATRNEEAQP